MSFDYNSEDFSSDFRNIGEILAFKNNKSRRTFDKEELMITIKRMGINGEGIGYYKKKIIFIPGALTNEVVIAKIVKDHPKYLIGELIRVKEPSPDRVDFPKNVDSSVGGLELAHLSYPKQLEFKKDIIVQSLEKFKPRNYTKYKIKNTIPAPLEWHYRAKASYQVEKRGNKILMGLYQPNSHHLIDLPEMPTQSELTQKVMRKIGKIISDNRVAVFDRQKNPFGVKTVVVRESWSTKEVQVTIITVGRPLKEMKTFADEIMKIDHVVSVFNNLTTIDNDLMWGEQTALIAGQETITEEILGKKFALSPQAFFQLNPEQTVNLYQLALKNLELSPNATLIDAYSGVGTIGIIASGDVKKVIGVETIPEAVSDAKKNVGLNNVQNADYLLGRAEKILPNLQMEGLDFDALVVDPPRTGLDKALIKTILQVEPETFVYISCNPSTLARDLVMLTEKYDFRLIQSIDMFPQTARVEAVVKLKLRK